MLWAVEGMEMILDIICTRIYSNYIKMLIIAGQYDISKQPTQFFPNLS